MANNIEFSFTRPISPDALYQLYQQTDWANTRPVSDIGSMLERTSLCLGAWQGEQLVGFARVLTDDQYRAFIEDVVITEEVRGQGLGLALIRHLMERLAHVQDVSLGCVEGLVSFYERFGFQQNDDSVTMHRYISLK